MDKSPALDAVAESGINYRVVRFEPTRDRVEAVPVRLTKPAGGPR